MARYALYAGWRTAHTVATLRNLAHTAPPHDSFLVLPSIIMASTNGYRVGRAVRRTLTCDMCKTRHQKCNGAQPQCSNCELRAISCSYSNQRAGADQTTWSPEPALHTSSVPRRVCSAYSVVANPLHSPEGSTQARLSEAEYDRLHSQIYEDIVSFKNIHLTLQC